MHRSAWGALVLACGLSACTLEPAYQRPALPVSAVWPGAPAATPGQAPAPADAAHVPLPLGADLAWRDFFQDPALRRLIELALQNNRDLRVAALNVAEYQAQYRIARSALLPTVDATGAVDNYRALGTVTRESSVNLGETSWELDFFGQLRSLKYQALEQYLASDASRASTLIGLVASVASGYFQWLADRSQAEIAADTADTDRQSYELTQQSERIGTASMQDVRQAQSAYANVRSSLAAAQRAVAQDENDLAALLGCPVPGDLLHSASLEAEQLPALGPGLPSDLLTRRPDIVAAEHALKAANANIGAARAAFFPSIQLTSSAGTSSAALSGLFKAATGAWAFAPSVTLPIFDYGNHAAALDVAKIQKQIEVANYEKSIQTAFKEVANALAARSTYVAQVASDREYVDASARYESLAQARYRAGTDSFLTLLDAQRTLYAARQQFVTDRLGELDNSIALYKALGGGWTADGRG